MKSKKLYKKYSKGRHWENHPTLYAETFAKFLQKNKFNGLLIDVGCGNGRDVNIFSKFNFKVIGIDCSEKEIDTARRKFPQLKFEIQNAEKLILNDNSIDAYYMINVIHYVDKEKAIQEIHRTLKPKSYCYIHFNVEIKDKNGNVDYKHDEGEIIRLVSPFKIVHKRIFKRNDSVPIQHTHTIMELILQK